jgi:hypothetical protein
LPLLSVLLLLRARAVNVGDGVHIYLGTRPQRG